MHATRAAGSGRSRVTRSASGWRPWDTAPRSTRMQRTNSGVSQQFRAARDYCCHNGTDGVCPTLERHSRPESEWVRYPHSASTKTVPSDAPHRWAFSLCIGGAENCGRSGELAASAGGEHGRGLSSYQWGGAGSCSLNRLSRPSYRGTALSVARLRSSAICRPRSAFQIGPAGLVRTGRDGCFGSGATTSACLM